jgi:hypothetical protein
LSRRRTELGPKNAVRLVAVLEHTLPPSQLTIDGKNEPRQRWPPVCSRQNLDATHGTHPGCQPCGSGDAGRYSHSFGSSASVASPPCGE